MTKHLLSMVALICIFTCTSAQLEVEAAGLAGADLSGNKNLFPHSFNWAVRPALNIRSPEKRTGIILAFAYQGANRVNRFLSEIRLTQYSFGLIYQPFRNISACELKTGVSYNRIEILQNRNNLPTELSNDQAGSWGQWGYTVSLSYFLKPWLGLEASYQRCIARSWDPENFQSYFQAGVVLRKKLRLQKSANEAEGR